MSDSVGFIGLGNMGEPIAGSLLKAGYGVRVFNRTSSKAEPLVKQGARLVGQARDVAEPGGIVLTMLSDDPTVEAICRRARRVHRKAWSKWNPYFAEHHFTSGGSTAWRNSTGNFRLPTLRHRCSDGPKRLPLGRLNVVVSGEPAAKKQNCADPRRDRAGHL